MIRLIRRTLGTQLMGSFIGLLLLAGSVSLWASTSADEQFRETAKQLRCPTCTGLSVLDSDAPFSAQIKTIVREQVEQGKSREQILGFFVERYGPWILREPPKEGFSLLAWVVPMALLLVGPIGVWFAVWRRQSNLDNFKNTNSKNIDAKDRSSSASQGPEQVSGVRPASEILAEMESRLQTLRAKRS